MTRNMQTNKTPMPQLDPHERARVFDEVALGYGEEAARSEANRCLNCKNKPCVDGCPVNVAIPDFIAHVQQGDFAKAYDTIRETNALPAVCGRVCPQETQCEARCVRGIKGESVAIGRLERFVADWARENVHEERRDISADGRKVAVIGSGPAGLTCASDLCEMGYDVTVFEAFHQPGGVLVYGIPEFRLPKEIVRGEIDALAERGVKINLNMVAGRLFSVPELFDMGFEAVFIGTGAGLPTFMNIPGENLNGVYSANEFLTRVNLMRAYDDDFDTPIQPMKKVAVIGGGNVAMDAARCALRLGAEATIVYRRSEDEMPARREEIHHAREEGVRFEMLSAPVRVVDGGNGWAAGLECRRAELGEADSSGRRRPVEIPGSEFVIEADSVIIAIGSSPNPILRATTPGLEAQKWGGIIAGDDGATSISGVFAGGDAVTGAATVILAMGAGKKAAAAIDAYLMNN